MNSAKFLYKYLFRGIGWVLLAGMATIFWTACSASDVYRDAPARAKERVVLKTLHGDPSAEMLQYRLGIRKPKGLEIQKEKAR